MVDRGLNENVDSLKISKSMCSLFGILKGIQFKLFILDQNVWEEPKMHPDQI